MATMNDMFGGNTGTQSNPWSLENFNLDNYNQQLSQNTSNIGDRVFNSWDYSSDGIGNTINDFMRARPDMFNGMAPGTRKYRVDDNSESGGGSNYWDFGSANDILKNYEVQRRGEAGVNDGRRDVVVDKRTGQIVYAGANPYSYDPASKNLNDAATMAALVAGGYYGVNALAGMGGAAGATSAMGGAMPTVAAPTAAAPGLSGAVGGWGSTGATLGSALAPAGGSLLGAGAATAGAAGAGQSLLGGAMPEVGTAGIDATAGLTAGGMFPSIPSASAAMGGGSFLNGLAGSTAKDLIKKTINPGGGGSQSGGGNSGGINYGNVLSGLAQLYSGSKYQDSVMDLYKSLDQSFAPGSAYEKTLRQQLDRRDAAAGRRSQYGPREVELQAKLAEMRGNQATTLAGLLDKSQTGLNSQLQAGIGLGKDTGLTDWLGNTGSSWLKDIGKNLSNEVTDSEWWNNLFGGD